MRALAQEGEEERRGGDGYRFVLRTIKQTAVGLEEEEEEEVEMEMEDRRADPHSIHLRVDFELANFFAQLYSMYGICYLLTAWPFRPFPPR